MKNALRFALLLPAAGRGSRIGGELPKQYVEILGEPVLRHTVSAFLRLVECTEVVIAIDEFWQEKAQQAVAGLPNVRFVNGGKERQDSIRNGLESLGSDPEFILVHDAARPVVSSSLVRRVLEGARNYGAAIPALPVAETVKLVDSEGIIQRTIPREGLYTAQTPQGFRADLLRRAYRHARQTGFVGTDDASLVEHLGERVVVVAGESGNIKITWPDDFRRAEEGIRRLRNDE